MAAKVVVFPEWLGTQDTLLITLGSAREKPSYAGISYRHACACRRLQCDPPSAPQTANESPVSVR